MNWRTLKNPNELVGTLILLREEYPNISNANHIAGIIVKDADGFAIADHDGKRVQLKEEYRYYYIMVNEILF